MVEASLACPIKVGYRYETPILVALCQDLLHTCMCAKVIIEATVENRRLTKQNTIDDFIAGAEYMIENNYTRPRAPSGEGASAGGILIGAITQRPDLFAGALIRIGCSNALRLEFTPNGPPNIAEFGTVTDPDGFRGLYAMDAYQHVKDGTAYPGVLLTAGINDPRVDPSQAAKLTARLQSATSSKKPVLLRVD